MRCEEVRDFLSLYIDNELDDKEIAEIEKHLQSCEECNREYEDLLTIQKLLSETPQIELPHNFKAELHQKLVECVSEEKLVSKDEKEVINLKERVNKNSNRKKKFNWKILSGIAAALFLTVVSASLINNDFGTKDMAESEMKQAAPRDNMLFEMAKEEARDSEEIAKKAPMEDIKVEENQIGLAKEPSTYEMAEAPGAGKRNGVAQSKFTAEKADNIDGKVILSGYLHLEVEQQKAAYESIEALAVDRGGYVEGSDEAKSAAEDESDKSSKMSKLVVRVPRISFKDIYNEIAGIGKVIDQNENAQDVTNLYNGAANRLAELEQQDSELKDGVDVKETDENYAGIQKESSKIQEEVNDLRSRIESWDDLVELSVIDITLEEADLDTEVQN
ncbi:DUF4349 domain-containing protein [Wukongibacter sp. M2B1]|uniref:DUF4349 domain-containing protein n=1 Tax=Wukongibacter sp. M2B1 TaxID=3088895 RepID=UPI003D7C0E81